MATNTTLYITLNSYRNPQAIQGVVRTTTDARNQCRVLEHIFQRLMAGAEAGNFTLQTSPSTGVRATATVTLTNASIANNDTLTIAGVVFTAKTSGAAGAQFNIGANALATAQAIAAAVAATPAAAGIVNLSVSATGVITVQANAPGAVGNFVPLATSNATGFALSSATLTGGTGGAATAPNLYIRGAT